MQMHDVNAVCPVVCFCKSGLDAACISWSHVIDANMFADPHTRLAHEQDNVHKLSWWEMTNA